MASITLWRKNFLRLRIQDSDVDLHIGPKIKLTEDMAPVLDSAFPTASSVLSSPTRRKS